jgi:hypothetical protein
MDTDKDNSINIHLRDNTMIQFKSSGNGLYQYTIKQHQTIDNIWTLMIDSSEHQETFPMHPNKCFEIETVAGKADRYTNRQLKAAKTAREMEDIIMRPGIRKFTDTCLPHLSDCPVTTDDINAANDIFGKNLGSIKGKTVHRPNPHVNTNILPVPNDIMSLHKKVTLAIDIMFVNKIPFLVTTSRKLHFGTVEALPDRKLNTIVTKLRSVNNTYRHRGFNISTILADGEFEPIRPWFPQLNTCAENEHVPDIERYIRTIKDSTRSTYSMLPFNRIPRIMVIQLVKMQFYG